MCWLVFALVNLALFKEMCVAGKGTGNCVTNGVCVSEGLPFPSSLKSSLPNPYEFVRCEQITNYSDL